MSGIKFQNILLQKDGIYYENNGQYYFGANLFKPFHYFFSKKVRPFIKMITLGQKTVEVVKNVVNIKRLQQLLVSL